MNSNMNKSIKYLALIFILVLMSACNALKLNEANQALSNHYFAKERALEKIGSDTTNAGNVAMLNSMGLALKDLAIETKQQADDESNVKNQIAFYRISATAAWQSGMLKASDYAAKGHMLCQSTENREDMEVHCAMIAFIPLYSAVDENTDKANTLQADITKAKKNGDTETLKQLQINAQSIFDNYKTAITAAMLTKKSVENYQLSDSFIAQVDANLRDIVCNKLEEANTLLSQAGGGRIPNEATITALRGQVGEVIVGDCEGL